MRSLARWILVYLAAIFGICALVWALTPPASAQNCMRWEDGQANAAAYAEKSGDRVSGVLLTADETKALWAALFPASHEAPPTRIGIHIMASRPDQAYLAGFDENGCVTGSGTLSFGVVIDAMTKAGVKSEFAIVEPIAPSEGA